LARKITTGTTDNAAFSQIDKTSIFFTQACGACHPGGGPAEFDRDGNPYVTFNSGTGVWEFSAARQFIASYFVDPANPGSGVSGDYAFVNPASPSPAAARWDLTGVAEADCLMCHMEGYNWVFRTATLGAGPGLMASSGIPAFASAATAGAGFANVTIPPPAPGKMPQATAVVISYPADVDNVYQRIVRAVPDANCRGCHSTPDLRKAGRSWETDTDVHKSGGLGCVFCHPAGSAAQDSRINAQGMHEIAKGNITVGSVRDDIDGTMMGCKACHEAGGVAPDPAQAHAAYPAVHFSKLACNVCHIPYLQDSVLSTATEIPDLVLDYATDGNGIIHGANRFLSNNPTDPTTPNPDNTVPASRWYPAFLPHAGTITTVKPLVTIWWGLWNGDNTTPIVKPIILRNLRKAIGFAQNTTGTPPAGKSLLYTAKDPAGTTYYRYINTTLYSQLTDANGDGIVEVNTPAEIVAFIDAIAPQADHFGEPIVPAGWQLVMVKSGKVYYKTGPATVAHFENAVAESPPFAVNHNVRPAVEALGAGGCTDCHNPDSAFFYRKELVDPYDEADQSVYMNAYEAMGYTAERAAELSAGVPSTSSPSSSGGGGGCAVVGGAKARSANADALGFFAVLALGLAIRRFGRKRK